MADNTQVQTQLTALRTLQQSYDALATASESGATAAALENAKQAILDAIAAIDMSDLAKEVTLNSVGLDAAAAKTAAQSITGYALQGSDATATNTGLKDILNTISTNMYKGVPVVSQSGNATISPNVWNVWQSVVTDLTIAKGNNISGIVNEYIIRLTLDSSWIEGTNTITFNGWTLKWNGGSVPTWTAGHIYEISIVDNIALWADITPAS